jgi:hypothetical protein
MTCDEICDVVSDDFLSSSKLLDEYQVALMNGENPDRQSFIDRCPESERQDFDELLKVSDSLHVYYSTQVSQETVDKAIARIKEIRDANKVNSVESVGKRE